MGRLRALACWLLLVTPLAAQEATLETIALRNRPAEDLVPVLEPLVGPGGSVTAFGGRLIVKAAPRAMREIKDLVAKLDVVPRSLWITVRQSRDVDTSGRQIGAGGGVVVERRDGRTTTTRTEVHGAFGQGSASERGQDVQQLRAVEGRPAEIHAGREQVVPPGYVQDAASGFSVIPWLSGDFVTLEIRTRGDRIDAAGRVEYQQLKATVNGRLGEWISLGGLEKSETTSDRGLLSRANARWAELRSVSLKVEEIP
jgi:hypothetical protein